MARYDESYGIIMSIKQSPQKAYSFNVQAKLECGKVTHQQGLMISDVFVQRKACSEA